MRNTAIGGSFGYAFANTVYRNIPLNQLCRSIGLDYYFADISLAPHMPDFLRESEYADGSQNKFRLTPICIGIGMSVGALIGILDAIRTPSNEEIPLGVLEPNLPEIGHVFNITDMISTTFGHTEERYRKINYTNIPSLYFCPIGFRVMDDPVIVNNPEVERKLIFERAEIVEWIRVHATCPLPDGNQVELKSLPDIVSIVSLREAIQNHITECERKYNLRKSRKKSFAFFCDTRTTTVSSEQKEESKEEAKEESLPADNTYRNEARYQAIGFKEERIPPGMKCPITRMVMDDPVIIGNPEVAEKYVYEREAINTAISIYHRCPKTNVRLNSPPIFISLHSVKSGIEDHLTGVENFYRDRILSRRKF